jgi:hypothetical protein
MTSEFNQSPAEKSVADLWLYRGQMTFLPHEGSACNVSGTIDLVAGSAVRFLRIRFSATDGQLLSCPASKDGRLGAGTTFMQLPGSEPFYVFVTSGVGGSQIVGEAWMVSSPDGAKCETFEIYLLNCLLPAEGTDWELDEWQVTTARTPRLTAWSN